MKKIILILIFSLTLIFAESLPDYVAKFDKNLAIELYETELKMGEDPLQIYSTLAKLYSETGNVGLAEDCYRHLIVLNNESEDSYKSYLDFLYENKSYEKVRYIIKENTIEGNWSNLLMAKSYFMEGDFESSLAITKQLPQNLAGSLHRFSLEGTEIKYRSPALGGIMSAIIPGSGKVYAGRLLDGMQAFSVVLAPAYNAYYHFNKTGTSSVRAWLWTAVASFFYLSDIYGSVKAVYEYNEALKFKLIERYEQ